MNYDGPEDDGATLPADSQPVNTEMADMMVQGTEYPYFSKSRVKTAKNCMRSFFYTYVMGLRFEGNFYTDRGTRIHKSIENYYERLTEAVQTGEFDEVAAWTEDLMEYFGEDDVGLWLDWIDPFIHNFLKFEERRLEHCLAHDVPLSQFVPHAVEAEGRKQVIEDGPEWMGYADAILHAASVPEIEDTEGYVIVDFKTGKTPKKQYRDEGIFLEGTFYRELFKDELDVVAVAGYFPMNDDFLVTPPSEKRLAKVFDVIGGIMDAECMADFACSPQPLCKWGEGDDEQCDHYDYCETSWGKPGGPGPTYSQD